MNSLLEIDNTTLLLAALIAITLALSFFARPPPPHVHPFLLGRQAYSSPTRLPGQSPVFSSTAGGGFRGSPRPEKRVRTLGDVVDASESVFEGGAQGAFVKGGEKVRDVVHAVRAGLLSRLAGGKQGQVVVLLDHPTDALVVILALALTSDYKPILVTPGEELPARLAYATIIHSANLEAPAQRLAASSDARLVSIGGEADDSEDCLTLGKTLVANKEAAALPEEQPTDEALVIVADGVALPLTHLNLTSSLVSWLSLFPTSRPTPKDLILSFHHPSTSYGLGLSLLSLYTSSSLSLPSFPSPSSPAALTTLLTSPSLPSPTHIFAPSSLLAQPLYSLLLEKMVGNSSLIITQSRNAKLRLLRNGVVSKSTWADWLLFSGLQSDYNLVDLKLLVLEGSVLQSRIEFFRMALGANALSTMGNPFLLAPLTAGLVGDCQRLPPPSLGNQRPDGMEVNQIGAPGGGVEVKLRGEEKDFEEGRMKGEMMIRSPLLPPPTLFPSSLLHVDQSLPQLPPYPNAKGTPSTDETWLRTGVEVEMGTEGVFWLV